MGLLRKLVGLLRLGLDLVGSRARTPDVLDRYRAGVLFPDFSFLTVNVAAVPVAVNFELPALQVAVALVIGEPPKLCATQVTLAFDPCAQPA